MGGRRGTRKPQIEARTGKGSSSYNTESYTRNFLDCIKTRGKCNADILTGHLSTSSTLIGNIAHKRRAMLEWDGRAERFTNDPRANELLHYKYRARRVCQGENSPADFSPPGGACVWAARPWGGSRCT
jgi:hypothetical protein